MSIDILSIIEELSSLIQAGITLLAIFRAVQIGRALVNRIFRRRAFWIAAVGVFIIFSVLAGSVPFLDSLLGDFFFIPFLVLIVVIFAFVDSTVLAAIEMDFFHRDTLRWKQLRRPSYAVPLALVLFFLIVTFLYGSATPPTWVDVGVIPLVAGIAVVFGYSVVTLIVAARRTPDRTMKRHVRLLGFALACFAIIVVNDFIAPFVLLNDFLGVVAAYLIYRAVMSLSPTSRIEKETV